MSSAQSDLHTGPPQAATPLGRVFGILRALMLVSMLYILGLPAAIYDQLTTSISQHDLARLLSVKTWRDSIVAHGLPHLLRESDKSFGHLKKQAVFPFARGRVLELGAGTGMTLKYYDPSKVSDLYLVEPMAELHDELRQSIAHTPDLRGKTHIVPCGVEQQDELLKHGISLESFDTIVLVQVLCSIPQPEKNLAHVYKLLKPDGQLLLFEHVASEDKLTNTLQHHYNPIWTTLSGGCNVNRASAKTVESIGAWKQVQVQRPKDTNGADFYPHIVGHFVKA